MALFRHNRLRSALYAGGLAILVHIFHRFIPTSHFAFSLTSTSVAILALSSLAIMTVAHHTRQGQVMTQTQEEMLLIGAFGLFWLSFLVILRAFRNRHAPHEDPVASGVSVSTSVTSTGKPKRPEWCSGDAAYCVVEEWKYSRY
ncbi:hypothetical protein JB92DRAFT_3029858 [Gautieria morchelliformis]|nr:hypothetical protein JB92DRAFT_3029858 [Gautieria morchelliformis]